MEAYQSVDTLWLFSPIEAKQYQVDVPLHITDGDSHVISFTGVGVDPHRRHGGCHGNDVTMTSSQEMESLSDVMAKQLIIVPQQLLKVCYSVIL